MKCKCGQPCADDVEQCWDCMEKQEKIITGIMNTTCACCDNQLMLNHTQNPEVSRCRVCGLPYWFEIPTPSVSPRWVSLARKYWNEKHMIVFPADYSIMDYDVVKGVMGGRDYGCSEIVSWNEFLDKHSNEWRDIV